MEDDTRGEDDVFRDRENDHPEFDDAAILAMCDGGTNDYDSRASFSSSSRVDEFPPLSFGMEGSTININHSRDIHFGVRTVTTPPILSNRSASSPLIRHNIPSTPATSCDARGAFDGFSMTSSVSSLNSNFPNVTDPKDAADGIPLSPPGNSRIIREGLSERLPSSFFVNLNSQLPTPSETGSYQRVLPSETGSYQSFPMDGSSSSTASGIGLKVLQKSISNPIGSEISSVSSAMSSSSRNALQCLPQGSPLNPSHPPMSAAINNSRNVQMGTQIVYNYYISEQPELRSPHCSSPSLSESVATISSRVAPESPKDYLVEFKEKLISVYQKRTRSSPLPWHRGKQLIPINEYYTEPQIFAVDKFGNRTSETVDIMSILNSKTETRFLVEGEAGMGKTLLATKLADEWANGSQLQQFQILLFITLGDFKGSLQQYVREELLPSYFKSESFEKVWEYCKTHDKEILFLLDGYDELERQDKGEIQNLMKNKDFPESKVVVTSRPNFLQDWEKKIVVSGFGQLQIMEFIEKYFRAIGNDTCGQSLRKIIEKDEKYWKLAKRPLFCVLLCMLYITGEVGESLPERQSDVMLQIILCLIKWNRKNSGNASIDFESLPAEYEKPFLNFGKLCLNALRTEKSRFSDQEVQRVDGFEAKLKQLGFLFNDNESHALGERKFWKPVHQTFLEYLGAFYIAKHVKDCKSCKECKGYDFVFQRSYEVLKFCVGILNNKAYKILDGQRYPVLWKLSVVKILQLLKEAEPKTENCQALAKLLDQTVVEISTSEIEFECWSYILSQQFRKLRSLRIAWRIKSKSPDQESSFMEASQAQYQSFFEALKNNESIQSIHVRAKQDGESFSDEKISMFFSHLETALLKKNLNELHIVEMKMNASGYIKRAIEAIADQPAKLRALHDLKVLKLHTFMEDDDLRGICKALSRCSPSLESLYLEGLEHGHSGFQSLVTLLKSNSNIINLHISMNQSLFVNAFGSFDNTEDYAPHVMRTEHKRMNRTAGRLSTHEFTKHIKAHSNEPHSSGNESDYSSGEFENRDNGETSKETSPSRLTNEMNPRKELAFLFDKIPLNNGLWALEAKRFWFLKRVACRFRTPLPLCVHREHKSVFHVLFMNLPETHVKNLTLSQPGLYLTTADLICLGDAVRSAPHLTSLNLQGLDKIDSYLPLLIGLGQSPSMTSVNFSSSKVVLKDSAFEVACAALQNSTSLRNVSLGRWQFHIKNSKRADDNLNKLLDSWQVAQLDLKQCNIELGDNSGSLSQPQTPTSPCSQPLNAFFALPYESSSHSWKSLKTLSLEGVELKEHTGLVRRGHLLLSGLTNFVNLISLDLSLSQSRSIQVDNISLRRFFSIIGSEMKQLVELKLDNWTFCLENKENSHDISSRLHSCKKLKRIQLERVNELVSELSVQKPEGTSWCRLTFLHQLVSNVPNLEELSLCYYRINSCAVDLDLATRISHCLHDHWHHTPYTVKFFNLTTEVDNVIYQILKRPPCRVKRTVGPSLIKTYEVKSVLDLMKIHSLS